MFIEAKDDGSGGDNWTTGAISRAKLQSNHHQQTDIQFFYRPDALPVAEPTASKHCMEKYHINNWLYIRNIYWAVNVVNIIRHFLQRKTITNGTDEVVCLSSDQQY